MSIKLCINCAHFRASDHSVEGGANYDKCVNPEFVKLDLIRGNHSNRYCEQLRQNLGECSIEARGFTYNPGTPVEEWADEHEL